MEDLLKALQRSHYKQKYQEYQRLVPEAADGLRYGFLQSNRGYQWAKSIALMGETVNCSLNG